MTISLIPTRFLRLVFTVALLLAWFKQDSAAIEPWTENPWYWSHQGQPVVLIGGSDDDNLFQWPTEKLLPQLDRIRSAGGNFVRNTMSDRKDGGFEVYPFRQLPDGKYDLTAWNPIYWDRFESFLQETAKRNIFVQLEVWDRFDYTDNRADAPRRWQDHPYNPPNNVNYTSAETGLAAQYPEHPGQNRQPFFFSTPSQRDIKPLLRIQEAFVNKLLDHTLNYDHVLYCIDNETSGEPAWGQYWSTLIHQRAASAGKSVAVTEMWDDWDLTAERHRETFDHPEFYEFADISQNNHNRGDKHWNNAIHVRELLASHPRPMNTTKTYGADGNKFNHTDQDAIERFWRHLLVGVAAVRFHRPDSGLGINDKAFHCIRAARRVEAAIPFWNLSPANHLLESREPNEAYAASTDNQSTIVIFLPASAQPATVNLAQPLANRRWGVTWINVAQGQATASSVLEPEQTLTPPVTDNMVAILRDLDHPLLNGELLEINDRKAFVLLPPENLRRHPQPWVMYAPTLLPNYPDEHERFLHEQLLAAGIAVAGIDMGEAYGSPQGNDGLDALYEHLTEKRDFALKPALLGRSRGGLWVTSWAASNPERVAAIAGIYPVLDLTTYPGIEPAAAAYGRSPEQLTTELDQLNPIRKAASLAKYGTPVWIKHGLIDQVVPFDPNSGALRKLYHQHQHADAITVVEVADQGHNYWPGFFRDGGMIQFLMKHARSASQ